MKLRMIIHCGLLLLLILLIARGGTVPVAQAVDPPTFTVTGAKARFDTGLVGNTNLTTTINGAVARVTTEYVKARSLTALVGNTQLVARINQANARIVPEYVKALSRTTLVSNTNLIAKLDLVNPRIVPNYAKGLVNVVLGYPGGAIKDTIPPVILVPPQMSQGGQATVTITWVTNEFTTSEVKLGTRSGQYSQTVNSPLFSKTHEVEISEDIFKALFPGQLAAEALASGSVYYQVSGVDQNGNRYTSAEASFSLTRLVFVPLTLR